jgi:5'-3' exonuclease
VYTINVLCPSSANTICTIPSFATNTTYNTNTTTTHQQCINTTTAHAIARFVEAYLATDVERELGLARGDMVALAMLLGSDYTTGVKGIGIVNAMEVREEVKEVDTLLTLV